MTAQPDDTQSSNAATASSSAEAERLQALLLDAEQRAASVPQLQARAAQLERELALARAETHEVRGEVQALDRRLMESRQVLVDVMRSPVWQATKPLRLAKRMVRDARS